MRLIHIIIIEVDGQVMSLNNKISIIIRTKNEERWIGHSIQSVIDFFSNPEIISYCIKFYEVESC